MLEGLLQSHRWWVIRVEHSIPERNSRSQIVLDVRYIHPARIPELRQSKGVPFSKSLYNIIVCLYLEPIYVEFKQCFCSRISMDWMYPRPNAKQFVQIGSVHLTFDDHKGEGRQMTGNPKYDFFGRTEFRCCSPNFGEKAWKHVCWEYTYVCAIYRIYTLTCYLYILHCMCINIYIYMYM